jgi:hypothetical protein
MIALRKLRNLARHGVNAIAGWDFGFGGAYSYPGMGSVASADQAALRLYSLPRGFRQRSRCSMRHG